MRGLRVQMRTWRDACLVGVFPVQMQDEVQMQCAVQMLHAMRRLNGVQKNEMMHEVQKLNGVQENEMVQLKNGVQ